MNVGTASGTSITAISETIRFVADRDHKMYTTKAIDGHWKIKLPAGTDTVRGLSTKVYFGERVRTRALRLVVRAERPVTNVRFSYSVPTG